MRGRTRHRVPGDRIFQRPSLPALSAKPRTAAPATRSACRVAAAAHDAAVRSSLVDSGSWNPTTTKTGSDIERVVRHSPAPVLLVRHEDRSST